MIIKEFLPNPIGADKDGEYIKIFNDADRAVNLSGWKISDASNKSFALSGTLDSKQELILWSSKTKISLNNNGETISLFGSAGELADKLSYVGAADEGRIITNQKFAVVKQDYADGEVLNANLMSTAGKIFATDFVLSVILGLVAVYVILQIEKKLDIKLF